MPRTVVPSRPGVLIASPPPLPPGDPSGAGQRYIVRAAVSQCREHSMYEGCRAPLASPSVFLWRVAGHLGLALAVALGSLGVGMWGYGHYERLAWRDAFLN